MKRLMRTLSVTCSSVLLIGLLAACNNPTGGRGTNGSLQRRAPTATTVAQPPAVPLVSTPQEGGMTNAPSDLQGDEVEKSLDDLANELNSTDTLDDFK